MKNKLQLLTALVVATFVSIPLSAAAYLKFEGIPGESKDETNKGTIEIVSWSLGASRAGNRVQGNYIGTDASGCATGPLKFQVKGTPAAGLTQLCQSRGRITSVIVDLDGVKHTLQNASFDGCQTGTGTLPQDQFSLNFAKCTTHAHAGMQNALQPNAKLIGLAPAPQQVQMERLTLNGSGATMTFRKVGTGHLILPAANQKLPALIVELTNGQKWTFYEVTLEDALISSATPNPSADRPSESLSLNFTKMVGPPAGFQAGR